MSLGNTGLNNKFSRNMVMVTQLEYSTQHNSPQKTRYFSIK